MGAWFIGAKRIEDGYESCNVMKSDVAECDDAGKDAWVGFLKAHNRWKDGVTEEIPLERPIFFDGGGAVRTGEPKVSWEANGCRMKTYVRHLPFVLDTFKELKPLDELPGVMGFHGWHRKYFLSPETVRGSIESMERLLLGTEQLRQELEEGMQATFNLAGHAVSLRKCGCLSGLAYVDCCGKAVESGEHRELRKAIQGPSEHPTGETP